MKWKAILFWLSASLLVISSSSSAQNCTYGSLWPDQQGALGCCLSQTDQHTGIEPVSGSSCDKETEAVGGECTFFIDGNNRGGFETKGRSRFICDGEDGPRPWGPSNLNLAKAVFDDCIADEPMDFQGNGDATGMTVCVDGCQVVASGCAGFLDQWFCTGDKNGQMCSGGETVVQDQCDRDPTRPECSCQLNDGAMSATCMCEEDPLIFGDVEVCNDLLGGGDPQDPLDSDNDGQPDDSDPCPSDATNSCDDPTPPRDSDNDGVPDTNDPCPFDSGNDCVDDDGNSDGSGGSGPPPPAGDPQPGSPEADDDGDGIPNGVDVCPLDAADQCGECDPEQGFCPDSEQPPFNCDLDFSAPNQRAFCPLDMPLDLCENWLITNYLHCTTGAGGNIEAGEFDNDIQTVDEYDVWETPEDLELGEVEESSWLSSDCPAINAPVLGSTLNFDMSSICAMLSSLGFLILGLGYYQGSKILWGSF